MSYVANTGRPVQDQHLMAVVQAQAGQPPPNFGYIQSCWTVALLVLHLATRFRLAASASRVRRALHRAEFCWKRPKLAPARRRDPHTDEKEAKIAAALADPAATLLAASQDEADQQLLPILRAMWQRIGTQVRIPTPGQNAKRGVFGALNVRTGEWFYQLAARKRSADFLAFLIQLWTAYPNGRGVCVGRQRQHSYQSDSSTLAGDSRPAGAAVLAYLQWSSAQSRREGLVGAQGQHRRQSCIPQFGRTGCRHPRLLCRFPARMRFSAHQLRARAPGPNGRPTNSVGTSVS